MFKNEAHIMKEWITHYINEGVDHFFMIDNNSSDDYFDYLLPHIQNNKVTLIIDTRTCSQTISYNEHFSQLCKTYEWVIVCDLDEFIYARKGFNTIKEYLNTLDSSVSQIAIPWKIFGSNGFNTIDKPQPESVIKTFTKRLYYDKNDNFQGIEIRNNKKYSLNKCIIRTKKLLEFYVHNHAISDNNFITTYSKYTANSDSFDAGAGYAYSIINEEILENSFLHLNHYAIQSFNWFMRVKATRGDILGPTNPRNEKYFNDFDYCCNDIVDEELYNKTYN